MGMSSSLKWIPLIGLSLIAAPAGAQSSAPQSHSPSCPDDDGSADASAGTPQYPTLLRGDFGVAYATTIKSALGCNVAGVDYRVGLPSGATLNNPTNGGLPSGCSYDSGSHTVTCTTPTTISGWDFSVANGLQLLLNGSGTWMVSGNNFGVGSNCLEPIRIGGGVSNVVITKNNIDGGGSTCASFGGGVNGLYTDINGIPASATRNITYNWIKNIPEDAIDFSSGPSSGSVAPVIAYNLFDLQGWIGHPDGVQECGGNFTNLTIKHNTYRQYYFAGMQQGVQPLHTEAQCTSTITNTVTAYNTLVIAQSSNGSGTACTSKGYPANCGANFAIACKQDKPGPPTNINTGFAAYGNYLDARGALAALTNGYSCFSTTWGSPQANWDMFNNKALPTSR
jgi:hypothetical protein